MLQILVAKLSSLHVNWPKPVCVPVSVHIFTYHFVHLGSINDTYVGILKISKKSVLK